MMSEAEVQSSKNMRLIPPLSYFQKWFHYDRDFGILYWKDHWHPGTRTVFVGKEAGSIKISRNRKYKRIHLAGKNFYNHSIIYYLENGIWSNHIDHIDGNSLNNHYFNLREVTLRENHQNRDRHLNLEKMVGTHFRKDTQRWSSKICIEGKEYYLGCYDTEFEAHEAYLKKLNEHLSTGGK